MSLVSPQQFLDSKKNLLPGYTEYAVVVNLRGVVDKEYTYKFSEGEEYKTQTIDDKDNAYTVTITGILGSGLDVDLQSSASRTNAGLGASVNAVGLPILGAETQVNFSRARTETSERNSTLLEMVFKIKKGTPTSKLSVFVYTFSLEKAKKAYLAQNFSLNLPKDPLAESKVLGDVPIQAFGPSQWSDYFGIGVDMIPVPDHLQNELRQNPDRYTLVFIPAEVQKEDRKVPLDFSLGIELLSSARKKGFPFQVSKTSLMTVQPIRSSRWILLTKQCFKETLCQQNETPTDYLGHKQILRDKYPSHRTPKAWEAFLAIALHRIHTGEVLYGETSDFGASNWMRCENENDKIPIVGGYNGKGLRIKEQQAMLEKASNIGMAGVLY